MLFLYPPVEAGLFELRKEPGAVRQYGEKDLKSPHAADILYKKGIYSLVRVIANQCAHWCGNPPDFSTVFVLFADNKGGY